MIAMKKKQSMWRFNVIIVIITLSLVGGLEHEFYDFPFSWNFITPSVTDELIFFRGVGIPPTRCVFTGITLTTYTL
jgi:hypothetical protein